MSRVSVTALLGMAFMYAPSVAAPVPQAINVADNFNRPDGGSLGVNWTTVQGGFEIRDNRARSVSAGTNLTLYAGYETGFTSTSLVVFGTPGISTKTYLAHSCSGAADGAFIGVGDENADGQFETIHWTTSLDNIGASEPLVTPFSSARISTRYEDVLFIDNDFDGLADETYQHSGALAGSGIGFGIASTPSVIVDDYQAFSVYIPEPSAALSILTGGAMVALRRTKNR